MTATMQPEPPIFMGCWGGLGHYCWTADRKWSLGTPDGCPWPALDASENTPSQTPRQGAAALEHREGMTMLGVHDYSVDDRPGSRAVFVLPGELTADEAIRGAAAAFPEVVSRIGRIVVFEDRTDGDSGSGVADRD